MMSLRASCSGGWWQLLMVALCWFSCTLVTALPSALLEKRQAPNQLYISNPTLQTGSFNMTTFIIPIPLSSAYSLASPYNLMLSHNLPTSVIPSGYFPLQIVVGYYYDIRQKVLLGLLPLSVQQLSSVEVYLPFVDRLGGGQTAKAFRRSVVTYLDQLIPALVGGVTQFHNAQVAYFDPAHAAYKAAGGNQLSFLAGQGLVDTVDGPGITSPLVQALFSRTSTSTSGVSEATFRAMLDQPYYTSPYTGCNKATLYYNYSNTNTSFVQGDVQVYTPIVDTNQQVLGSTGYTAATQWVEPSSLADCTTFG